MSGRSSDHITPFQIALSSTLKKLNAAIPKTRVCSLCPGPNSPCQAQSVCRLNWETPQSCRPFGGLLRGRLGSLHPESCLDAPGDASGDFQGLGTIRPPPARGTWVSTEPASPAPGSGSVLPLASPCARPGAQSPPGPPYRADAPSWPPPALWPAGLLSSCSVPCGVILILCPTVCLL